MNASLVREIAHAKGLSQRQMAELLGVSLDRVKSLTSGRVQKLSGKEAKALVEKLGVRGRYLATGNPPMFKFPGEIELEPITLMQAQFKRVMSRLQDAVGAASSAELGRMLGLTTSAYANRKKSGSLPYEAMTDLARAKGISLDWLMHGEGPKEAPWSLARATEARLCAALRDTSPYGAELLAAC